MPTAAFQLQPFDDLIAQLRARGLATAADSIAGVKAIAWTTSQEMIGELGLAVLRLQAEKKSFPPELIPLANRCMTEVRKVWPDIRLT